MSSYFSLGKIAGPSLKAAVITSIIGWFIKSCYIHFAGVVLFPNKNTNCNFRKTLILTGLTQSPLIFNVLVLNQVMLPLVFVTYIWYNICLIVGINVVYNYKSIVKSSLIVLAPFLFFLLYILSNFAGSSVTLT